jgi:hypothetical protein
MRFEEAKLLIWIPFMSVFRVKIWNTVYLKMTQICLICGGSDQIGSGRATLSNFESSVKANGTKCFRLQLRLQ